jgi:hypothetical protein
MVVKPDVRARLSACCRGDGVENIDCACNCAADAKLSAHAASGAKRATRRRPLAIAKEPAVERETLLNMLKQSAVGEPLYRACAL